MKNLLSADFYHFRRSRLILGSLIAAAVSGMFIPLIMKGLLVFIETVSEIPGISDAPGFEDLAPTIDMLMTAFSSDMIWMMTLPIAEGFGIAACPLLALYVSKQFSCGIVRNKIIAGQKRTSIYVSSLIFSLVFMIASAALFNLVALGFSRLLFGSFSSGTGVIVSGFAFDLLVYAVYAAIITFIVYKTRSTGLSLILAISLPLAVNLILSFASTFVLTLPDGLVLCFNVLPSFQTLTIAGAAEIKGFVPVAVASDLVWIAALSFFGMLSFRKTDLK